MSNKAWGLIANFYTLYIDEMKCNEIKLYKKNIKDLKTRNDWFLK